VFEVALLLGNGQPVQIGAGSCVEPTMKRQWDPDGLNYANRHVFVVEIPVQVDCYRLKG
jgi:hypothetical protein